MFFNTKTTILRSQFFRTSATYARLSLKFLSALPYFNKFLKQIRDYLLREAGFRVARHVMASICRCISFAGPNTWPGTQAGRP